MTPYFKVKYSKKGVIPSGVSEDVYISFTPDSYKYYYDCVRIHCEGEKLLVPIHGYPVINNDLDELLPSVVDLGKVKVGELYSKKLTINCTSPVTFEYTIEWLKPHNDIMVEPMTGDILGNSKTKLEVTYSPTESTTAQASFRFITTEFDSEPQIVSIVASAVKRRKHIAESPSPTHGTVVKKTKSRTLLQKKSKKRPASRGGKLKKIDQSRLSKTGAKQISELGEGTKRSEAETVKPVGEEEKKTVDKLNEEERGFLVEYRDLEKLDREKEIKFFSCIGDPASSTQAIQGFSDVRDNKLFVK